MAVESNAVQITIDVVDKNSAAAVGQVTKNIESMGGAGATTGEKVAQGMDKIKGHSLSALDNVRLLRDDIGVRIPRSMEKAIASSQLLMGAIRTIGTGLLAIGAIDIGIRIGKGLYDAYEKWIDVDAAIERYNREAAKAAVQKFDENRSLEDLNSDLKQANELLDQLNQKRSQAPSNAEIIASSMAPGGPGYQTYRGANFGMADAQAMDAAQGRSDEAALALAEKKHQAIVRAIGDRKIEAAARVEGVRKAKIEQAAADQVAIENQKYKVALAQQLAGVANRGLNPGDPGYKTVAAGAGDVERIAEQQHNAAVFKAAAIEDARKTTEEIRKIHAQAEEAEAAPIHKLEIERKAADDEWVRQHGQNAAVIADIDRRFYAEEKKLAREAADKQIEEAKRWLDSALEIVKKQEQAQQEFAQHVDRIMEASASRGLQGFARIHAEAQREIADLQAEFANKTGASPADLQRGIAGIHAGEGANIDELRRRNEEETAQFESEARAKFLSAEKQQTSAIEEEYKQRLRKFQEELDTQMISQQDYDRRIVAAAQLRDAQMAESARQAREKMAGEFTRFFADPLRTMKEMGSKAAGEAAAALVQRVQGRSVGTGGEHLGMPGSIFDRIAGVPSAAGSGGVMGSHAGGKQIALASAIIQVQNASVMLGGVGAASPSLSTAGFSGGFGGSGSTSLLDAGSGASFSSGSTAVPGSFAGSTSNVGGGAMGAIGGIQQGLGLFNQAKGIFGAKSATSSGTSGLASLFGSGGATGTAGAKSGFGASLLGGGGMSAAGGAIGGGLGLFSAFEGSGGFGGALSGAMSGMQLGMSVGGPIGAAIGAAGGAILGAIGFGGREKARVYDLKTVRPRIQQDILGYQQGGMDYTSSYSDLQSLDVEAKKTLKGMGSAGNSYYWDTVIGEIHQAEGKLNAEERAGRSHYTAVAGQYASGTDRVPQTAAYLLHQNESVYTADRTDRTEAATRALEAAADSRTMPAQDGFGGDIHLHVHSMDSKTVMRTLMDHKHDIRAAYNASFAENSGGADA